MAAGGGLDAGSGVLLDINGGIGRVSISVILVPFPHQTKPESAKGAGAGIKLAAQNARLPSPPVSWG